MCPRGGSTVVSDDLMEKEEGRSFRELAPYIVVPVLFISCQFIYFVVSTYNRRKNKSYDIHSVFRREVERKADPMERKRK